MSGGMPTYPGSNMGYPHHPMHSPGQQYQVPPVMYPLMSNARGAQPMFAVPQTAPHMNSAGRSMGAASHSGGAMYGRTDTAESLAVPTETREKLGEFTEVHLVEKIVEVPQRVQQEKIVQVPRVEIVERKILVPKPVYKEKIVEVPQIQYRDVPVEKIVEVPEVQTQVMNREVEVMQVVDVPVVQPRRSPIEQDIQRNIPMPIELRVAQGYEIPKLKPKYKEVPVPIYVPRYIEVPVPAQFVNAVQGSAHMASLTAGEGPMPSRMPTGASQEAGFNTGMTPEQQGQQRMLSRRQSSPIGHSGSGLASVQGVRPPSMSRQATNTGPLVAVS
eukprot:GHVS01038363.1.p1 GENE.GHVS01038363.1~~GHVS01038363.1.p1  ORF type:complete len:330 (+),score=47.25 GHVS01038363.1:137-1126(+)